ncbi:putative ribonuclease H-like domain-containing protein [Tanacetum coccineum]
MNEFCAKKGIKMEFSMARTPQQNGVAERKNRTLIEAARTVLADSLLRIPFWAETVITACYTFWVPLDHFKHLRPSETQPTPSSSHPSEDPIEPQPDPSLSPSSSNPILDSIPEGSGGNHGGQSSSDRSPSRNKDGLTLQSVYDLCVSLCKQITTQAAQIKDLKSQIKQLKKKAKPVISHHNAWIKSVSMKKRLARKKSLKKKLIQKESISKQGRKLAKFDPTVHKDPAFNDFDDIVDDAIDYMETEDS